MEMMLFTNTGNINTTVPDIITQLNMSNKFYSGYRKLSNYLHVQGWFLHALEQRDREVLEFLLAEKQDCSHWKSKLEFIEIFLSTCNKLEAKQPIFLKILLGISVDKNIHITRSAVSLEVKSITKNRPLWEFKLAYHLDDKKKITLQKTDRFVAFIYKEKQI